jgi:hypothetical protein
MIWVEDVPLDTMVLRNSCESTADGYTGQPSLLTLNVSAYPDELEFIDVYGKISLPTSSVLSIAPCVNIG